MAKGFKTGGRRVGSLNKSNTELRSLAQQYTSQALETLAEIMQNTDASFGARIAAANSLLDRGHGKPTQAVELELGHGNDESAKRTQSIIDKLREKHFNTELASLL